MTPNGTRRDWSSEKIAAARFRRADVPLSRQKYPSLETFRRSREALAGARTRSGDVSGFSVQRLRLRLRHPFVRAPASRASTAATAPERSLAERALVGARRNGSQVAEAAASFPHPPPPLSRAARARDMDADSRPEPPAKRAGEAYTRVNRLGAPVAGSATCAKKMDSRVSDAAGCSVGAPPLPFAWRASTCARGRAPRRRAARHPRCRRWAQVRAGRRSKAERRVYADEEAAEGGCAPSPPSAWSHVRAESKTVMTRTPDAARRVPAPNPPPEMLARRRAAGVAASLKTPPPTAPPLRGQVRAASRRRRRAPRRHRDARRRAGGAVFPTSH